VTGADVLERAEGRSGELVLRRNGADLEIIADGTFLVSSANAASSEALVTAALPYLIANGGVLSEDAADDGAPAGGRADEASRGEPKPGLEVLIGGLGLGYALDVALAQPRVGRVIVAEYEPAIVDWFREYGEGRAARLAAGEAAGRALVLVADVADVLRTAAGAAATPHDAARGPFDLIALDTDNGPDWLVREANAGLYDEAGVTLAHAALRPGGVAVFWSPERYDWFAERLAGTFAEVHEVTAHDQIGRHRHEYTMYVARRGVD
jgi:SAM-dependent methyltransferase